MVQETFTDSWDILSLSMKEGDKTMSQLQSEWGSTISSMADTTGRVQI